MKEVIIFSGYFVPHLGGVEKYTENLSKEFLNKGINVTIVTSNYNNSLSVESIDGIKILRLPIYNIFKNRYPIPKHNKEYKKLIKILSNQKTDAIIVNTRFHLTSLIGAKYGKKNNIPVFLIEHGSQHLTVDNKLLDFFGAIYEHLLTCYIKKFVDYYFGVSQAACDWQKHFKISSNGVWHNSILNFANNEEIKKSKAKINILYAGRILKQKGIYELLDSFLELNKKYNNIRLTIAGDGNQLNNIREKYKNKNIKILGKVDFNILKKLYFKTDIFVYAPIWPEGLPTSILEAGLCNCAVISSPQGGIKEIINDNSNGLFINSKSELINSLEMLIKNKKLREKLSVNLKKTILNNFTWNVTSKKIEKDINERIKKK